MATVQPIKDKVIIEKMKDDLKEAGRTKELALVTMGLNTGLRISDILNLKWTDIKTIDGKSVVNITEQKTNKPKRLTLNGNVTTILNELRTEYPNDTYIFQVNANNYKATGKPWTRTTAYKVVHTTARRAGFQDTVGTHTLRKTFGYFAHKAGHSISLLQSIFNHSSQAITLRYIGITEQQKESVYLNINL